MDEIRTWGPRSQNKKIANHEWRVSSTGLCGTTLCAKEGRRERLDINSNELY